MDDLMKAIREFDRNKARQIIEMGADLNARDENGETVLRAAAMWGEKDIAELLINKGANLDLQNNNGVTALMYAAWGRHKQIAELLINKDANLDLQDKDGNTALMSAAKFAHKDIAELLIKSGANLDLQDIYGNTALIIAEKSGHTPQLVDLIKAAKLADELSLGLTKDDLKQSIADLKQQDDATKDVFAGRLIFRMKNIYEVDNLDVVLRDMLAGEEKILAQIQTHFDKIVNEKDCVDLLLPSIVSLLTGIPRAPLGLMLEEIKGDGVVIPEEGDDGWNKFIGFYRQSPKIVDLLDNPKDGQIDIHAIQIAAREFLMEYLSEVMENSYERYELYEHLTGQNGGSLASEIFHLHEYMLPESFQHTADSMLSLAGVTQDDI